MEDGTQISGNSIVKITSDNIMLYANWIPNQYNITLVYNDGTESTETVTVSYDNEYLIADPTREGYYFGGWFMEDGTQISGNGIYNMPYDIAIKAAWSKERMIITFNAMGGTALIH